MQVCVVPFFFSFFLLIGVSFLTFFLFFPFCLAIETFYRATNDASAEKEVIESFVFLFLTFFCFLFLFLFFFLPKIPINIHHPSCRNLSDFDVDLSSLHGPPRKNFLEALYDIDNQTLIKWLFGFSLFLFNLLFICSELLSTSKRWPKFYDVKKKEEQAARKKPLPCTLLKEKEKEEREKAEAKKEGLVKKA